MSLQSIFKTMKAMMQFSLKGQKKGKFLNLFEKDTLMRANIACLKMLQYALSYIKHFLSNREMKKTFQGNSTENQEDDMVLVAFSLFSNPLKHVLIYKSVNITSYWSNQEYNKLYFYGICFLMRVIHNNNTSYCLL